MHRRRGSVSSFSLPQFYYTNINITFWTTQVRTVDTTHTTHLIIIIIIIIITYVVIFIEEKEGGITCEK